MESGRLQTFVWRRKSTGRTPSGVPSVSAVTRPCVPRRHVPRTRTEGYTPLLAPKRAVGNYVSRKLSLTAARDHGDQADRRKVRHPDHRSTGDTGTDWGRRVRAGECGASKGGVGAESSSRWTWVCPKSCRTPHMRRVLPAQMRREYALLRDNERAAVDGPRTARETGIGVSPPHFCVETPLQSDLRHARPGGHLGHMADS